MVGSTIELSGVGDTMITPLEILQQFGKLRKKINMRATQDLKPYGLGSKQAILIYTLKRHETCSLAELSRETFTDPAATGKAIDALIEKGWVARQEHPLDRRRWQIVLSDQGRIMSQKIEEIYRAIADQVIANLTSSEQAEFYRMLVHMNQLFKDRERRSVFKNEGFREIKPLFS